MPARVCLCVRKFYHSSHMTGTIAVNACPLYKTAMPGSDGSDENGDSEAGLLQNMLDRISSGEAYLQPGCFLVTHVDCRFQFVSSASQAKTVGAAMHDAHSSYEAIWGPKGLISNL